MQACFRPVYKGRDLFKIPLQDSGASFGAPLEWVYAARFNGYKTMDFLREPVDDQVFMIAAYRTDARLNAVMAKERADAIDAANRR